MGKHRTSRVDIPDDQKITTTPRSARPGRIRALNAEFEARDDRLPLAACDCDNDSSGSTDVDTCLVGDEVDVNACGVWG